MATLLLLLLSLSGTDALRSHPHHTHSYGIGGPTHTYTPTALLSTTGTLFQDNDSDRLKKARLRLAEAQGIIPIGASETANSLGEFDLAMLGSQGISKVREISWRVAEPETSYDPQAAASKLFQQPVRWLGRNVQIFVPITVFAFKVLLDIALNREEQNRPLRAEQLLRIISAQSPALIKAGQALSSRSDLLPKAYLDALQQLQDRCPEFDTAQAVALFESELGLPFEDVFELDTPKPIAAASIGQVYKGTLKTNGAKVAIKIQRPKCEDSVAVDLYILRWYAQRVQGVLGLLGRDVNLVSIIDDFGELLYRELDYRAEAVNAQRFAELYASFPDVFVPKIYTDLSSSKVLVMEWVDGVRVNDLPALEKMGLQSSKLVDTMVQCTMRQMLENGFFHADPHAGNLLAMPNGKLCYLDFGMVSYVEPNQRYSIIEAVVHMVNRDFYSLAELYKRMNFIPKDVDTAPLVEALESALPDVLSASIAEFNFKNVIASLGDVMYKFPFSLPPFYIAIIRCMGVLEGLAMQIDQDFRIVSDAYPYIASRLLTDPSAELQAALQQLLFKDNNLRWDRLQELLEEATRISDYEISQAVDSMVDYLISDRGAGMREVLAIQMVEVLDQLETEGLEFLLAFARSGDVTGSLVRLVRGEGEGVGWASVGGAAGAGVGGAGGAGGGAGGGALDVLGDKILRRIENTADPDSSLLAMGKSIRILRASKGINRDNLSVLARKVLREPVLQSLLARVVSELSERVSAKIVRRVFGGEGGGGGGGMGGGVRGAF